MVSIISYNVNGLRSAISKSFLEWLKQEQCDIVCLQETKAQPEDIPLLEIEALGYRHYWHSAEKRLQRCGNLEQTRAGQRGRRLRHGKI